jgi:hypothetical protein
VWIGAAIALVTLGILIAAAWTAGGLRDFMQTDRTLLHERDLRVAVFLCVFVGFLPTAQYYMVRFTRANLAELASLLGPASQQLTLPNPNLWLVTLPSVLAFPLIALSIDRDPLLYFRYEYYADATRLFHWTVGVFACINTGRLAHLSIACARVVGRCASSIARIDLLDLSPLAPFARQSLQTILTWLLILSTFCVNAVDPAFLLPIAAIAAFCGGLVAATFALCNSPIHQRIRDDRRGQIQSVNAALRGDSAALREVAIASRTGQLTPADLLSYRRLLDDVGTWAFDSSAWVRFGLYLALPLGSWLGGAIVERLLNASLD